MFSLTLTAMVAVLSAAAAETLFQKLLRIAGLSASPAQMREPGDEFESGDVWVVTQGGRPVRLTSGGGYNSPIFSPVDDSLLALKASTVVRIPDGGASGVTGRKVPGALKLVGFDGLNSDEVVVLLESTDHSPFVALSLMSGKITTLPFDKTAEDHRRMLAQVRGHQRVYGDATVYIKTESKRGISRTIEWTDVYLQRGSGPPQNVSACEGTNCGQPALSPDGRKVAFVKSSG
jgi:hypothetical protein